MTRALSLLFQEIPHIEKFSEKDNARQGFFEDTDFERLVACLPEDLKDYVIRKIALSNCLKKGGGSVWESNPPSRGLAAITGFEVGFRQNTHHTSQT